MTGTAGFSAPEAAAFEMVIVQQLSPPALHALIIVDVAACLASVDRTTIRERNSGKKRGAQPRALALTCA